MASFYVGDMESNTSFVVDQFLTVAPGQPFRLLPVGRLVKNGKVRDVTLTLLHQFRLPHFKPPIKRGSHADEAPAAGHIVGLEVREDGLWAIPEYNEEGTAAVARGDYRYHSPEILWEGAFEDPTTGHLIEGPLIVGDALLHTPHLGEAAALYETTILEGEAMTTNDTVQMPASLFERFMSAFRAPEETPAPTPAPEELAAQGPSIDELAAVQQERDNLAARLAEIERARAEAARIQHFAAELSETPLAADADFLGVLAGLTDDQAAPVVQRIRALAEQVRVSNLTADLGDNGDLDNGDPAFVLDAAIKSRMQQDGISYNAALKLVRDDRPELFEAYGG